MTRHDHYASLPVAPHRQGGHVWAVASALQAARLFLAEEGRYPTTTQLHSGEGLPNYATVARLFGSLRGYLRALDTPRAGPSPYARRVACRRCDTAFQSWDVRQNRLCPQCNESPETDGAWMNNTHVTWSTDLGGMFTLEENGS